ncbi:MAG: O-antigen ligase family protein [Candidatus Eremiobacterota bacterium]
MFLENFWVKVFGTGIFMMFLFTPSADHLTALGLLLSLISFLILFRRSLKNDVRTPFGLPVIILLLAGLISISASINRNASLNALLCVIIAIIMFYLIVIYMRFKPEHCKIILSLVIISFSIIIIAGLLQFIFNKYSTWMDVTLSNGTVEHRGRLNSFFIFPNSFSASIVLVLPLIFSAIFLKNLNLFYKILLFILFATGIFCLISTYSRAGWIGFAVAAVVIIYLLGQKKRFILIPLIVFILISVSLLLCIHKETLKSYVFHNYSDKSRQFIFVKSLKMLKEHPLTGIGIGNFHYVYPLYMLPGEETLPEDVSRPWHAHNLFLNMAVEMGLPGLIAFLWFILSVFRQICLSIAGDMDYKEILYGIIAGLTGFLIFNQIDFVMGDVKSGIYFFIILAFGAGLSMKRNDVSSVE